MATKLFVRRTQQKIEGVGNKEIQQHPHNMMLGGMTTKKLQLEGVIIRSTLNIYVHKISSGNIEVSCGLDGIHLIGCSRDRVFQCLTYRLFGRLNLI
jgi:hypothetical protein